MSSLSADGRVPDISSRGVDVEALGPLPQIRSFFYEMSKTGHALLNFGCVAWLLLLIYHVSHAFVRELSCALLLCSVEVWCWPGA